MKRLIVALALLLLPVSSWATGLTPLDLPRAQFFNSQGLLLSGGLVYTYQCGTSTPMTTYTDSTGGTANANPVVLDTTGASTIWFSGCLKVNVTDYTGAQVFGYPVDNITDIGSFFQGNTQWQATGLTPTYVNNTAFSVSGNYTTTFMPGTRLMITDSGGTMYGSVLTATYTSYTTVTLVLDNGGAISGISAVSIGIIPPVNRGVGIQTINTQTTSYYLTGADDGRIVVMNSGSAISLGLPSGGNSLASGFHCTVKNQGAGLMTLLGYVDGVLNRAVAQGGIVQIWTDGTGYYYSNMKDSLDRNQNVLYAPAQPNASSGLSSTTTAAVTVSVTAGDMLFVEANAQWTAGASETETYSIVLSGTGSPGFAWLGGSAANMFQFQAVSAKVYNFPIAGILTVGTTGSLTMTCTINGTTPTSINNYCGYAFFKKQ